MSATLVLKPLKPAQLARIRHAKTNRQQLRMSYYRSIWRKRLATDFKWTLYWLRRDRCAAYCSNSVR